MLTRADTGFLSKIRMLRLLCPGMLAIFAVTAQTQSIHDIFGTEEFHRAYFAADTHEITFDGFQELDWDLKARDALSWLNLDRPTPPQIARLSTLESAGPQYRSVDFVAPLDAAVSGASYLLLYADGVAPIRPIRLKGSVSFDFDARLTAVQRRVTSGVIVAAPSRPVTSAAFALIGKLTDVHDVRPGAQFKRRSQAGPAVYDFSEDGHNVTWTIESTEKPDIASAVSFRLSSRHFLLVKWSTDFCNSTYTLFSVEATLKPIAGNDYDCDP